MDTVYGALVDYYGDLKLKLIKNENGWVVYAAKVFSGLNQNRYLFVITPIRAAKGEETTLEALDWVSFQTRTTDDVYQVPTHQLYLNDQRKKMLSDPITALERTQLETSYVTNDLPIKVKLIHDPKKKNSLQYPDKILLYQALETYQCVVELL